LDILTDILAHVMQKCIVGRQ